MNEEVRTDRIVEHIFECGKQCFVPWFKKDEMKLIKLISLEDYISLPRNKWNIAQPITVDDREDALSSDGLDLVLVPGLAFTLKGDRLGRGKGYYDRFLFSMSERRQQNGKPFQAIALSFKEQIVDNMPVTPKDFTVHSILYDER
ncbi:hypothetical protein AAG570_006847 [Ranatra chinensis]|uniref:5-formyltetrahydrofolate cyclo-ligase n=1 Tax=Ranatra chinensis TaxID=642074 RepID=A0ABD0YVH3_9HEMI